MRNIKNVKKLMTPILIVIALGCIAFIAFSDKLDLSKIKVVKFSGTSKVDGTGMTFKDLGPSFLASSTRYYKIQSKKTKHCLKLTYTNSSLPAIESGDCKGKGAQFEFVNSNGKVLIKNRLTQKCLYLLENGTFSAHTCKRNSDAYHWNLPKLTGANFQIRSAKQKMCLYDINQSRSGFGVYHCSKVRKDQEWHALIANS